MVNQLNFINVRNVHIKQVEKEISQSIWDANMESLKNVTTAISYLEANIIWIITREKSMEAQNTIAQIVTMWLAFNQNLMCMSRIFIQGEVRYRNLSFQTWYTRVQNVWSGWPVYEVKCLCFGGQEWEREGSHSHQLFNIWFLWYEELVIWIFL